MSADDKFIKAGYGTATTLSAPGYTSGVSTTVNVASTATWPTTTDVIFAIDEAEVVDGEEVRVDGTYNVFQGTVDTATSIIDVDYIGGDAERSYSAGALTRVYILSSSYLWNRLVDALLISLDQDGTLKAGAVDAAAVLADNVVTTAKINNDAVTGAKSTVFPVTTDRQDIAANSTASDPHIQYGWTYITGDAANLREAITITFPVAYDSAPVVIPGSVGYRTGSNPSTIGDLTSVASGLGDFGWLVSVHSITTTTCVLEINKHVTAIPAATRLGLSWIAIGPKAR